ncbi:catalase [Amycolatopsis keratiniphila]|uniref:Catalase n=1 Tax=Amycolatopsis keratiniphila subsp. keratiniphila TaxID=227715 RepID=A0A1W2M435_9PSEU|nr:catalase [Amycolatopsis keratiniphila]OLZ60344.1 catalase [Amycolatopsis keratiniphila subsp. nogabecina]ONF74914.1 catalase [Amycolatopsis keratiniphila subsp. keratiniphila]SDU58998.1 catalase [Amycolatopsis keratiniphila]
MTLPTTNNVGIPVASDNDSLTLGANGPILLQDHYLIEKNAQFNRERVPERVVHAKGGGAHGFLEVTEDVSQFTKAALFQPGVRTESLVRFSSVAGENGSPDTWRDPRGFAVKFYTSEGNYDLVGNNTPVFFIRDPIKFPDFIHSQKRRADNHLRDHDIQWDFWTLRPESAHQVTWLMGDRGIPSNWREMDGFGSHTYLWENAGGEKFWVKYHFKTDQGIGYLSQADADRIAGEDSDYYIRDLFKNIKQGNHPSWTLYVQVMPYAEAADYRFNPFDLTKVWPKGDYPLIKVGRWVLDRNPANYFAEIEQAAFEPSNLVPGIGPSPDKMLQGRLFAYPDAHRYRIGANYTQLPVNAPKSPVNSYSRDGAMRYNNPGDPVYAPNSYGGPHASAEIASETASSYGVEDEVIRSAYKLHAEDDDFGQPGTLVRDVMDDAQRERLASNIIGHASNDVSQPVLERVFEYWRNVDKDLGDKVADAFRK